MKKIFQTIKLRATMRSVFKDSEELLKHYTGNSWLVLYADGTWDKVYDKYDLIRTIESDHIKRIDYIIDSADKMTLDRDIQVDISEVEGK